MPWRGLFLLKASLIEIKFVKVLEYYWNVDRAWVCSESLKLSSVRKGDRHYHKQQKKYKVSGRRWVVEMQTAYTCTQFVPKGLNCPPVYLQIITDNERLLKILWLFPCPPWSTTSRHCWVLINSYHRRRINRASEVTCYQEQQEKMPGVRIQSERLSDQKEF